MKCPKCQAGIREGALFCSRCGASFKSEPATISQTQTASNALSWRKKAEERLFKYKNLEEIGRGGMGVVYKAEDTRLDRTVALKFLPADLTGDMDARARFIQEAKAAAALDHPNICTVYEVDEVEGQAFIAMAHIQGKSLKERLSAGMLPIEEAKAVAVQVAEGLGEAHRKGIVHRDIKPANIMISDDGRAKILDFGLAKLSRESGLTRPEMVLGTAAYMSPQQAMGETVDHRTDIWSLGIMLYEMVTREVPFRNRGGEALVHAILHEKPDPPSIIRAEIPRELDRIILRALEKHPDRRYQNMDEMLRDLRAVHTGSASAGPEKSIVVLPFANLSPDPDNEYFADGLTEEIIADLSMLDSLRVISRTSAMQFKQTNKDVRQIACMLDVQYVLEGSVRKAADKLRITAQLIEAESDRHLWADKYDGVLEDVFEIQEKVSRKIVEALKGRFTPQDRQQLSGRPSFQNVSVYEAYSRAQYEFWKSEPESTERALRLLDKAVAAFGEHPLLLSGIGAIHWQLYHYRADVNEVHLIRIKECVDKLFALDSASAHGHRLQSYLDLHAGDVGEAIRNLQRAMEKDPNDTETLLWLSYLLSIHAGWPDVAEPVAERWLALDPLHPISRMSIILVQWMRGDFEAAAQKLEDWHRKEPDNIVAAFYLGHLLIWIGRQEESLRLGEEMYRQNPDETMGLALRFAALAANGREAEAENALSETAKERLWMDFHLPWVIAEGYAVLENKAEALLWMERAVEKGNFNYPVLSELDPLLESIRGEPRFKGLMEKIKGRWDNFKTGNREWL